MIRLVIRCSLQARHLIRTPGRCLDPTALLLPPTYSSHFTPRDKYLSAYISPVIARGNPDWLAPAPALAAGPLTPLHQRPRSETSKGTGSRNTDFWKGLPGGWPLAVGEVEAPGIPATLLRRIANDLNHPKSIGIQSHTRIDIHWRNIRYSHVSESAARLQRSDCPFRHRADHHDHDRHRCRARSSRRYALPGSMKVAQRVGFRSSDGSCGLGRPLAGAWVEFAYLAVADRGRWPAGAVAADEKG
jgi:hypothetical protein